MADADNSLAGLTPFGVPATTYLAATGGFCPPGGPTRMTLGPGGRMVPDLRAGTPSTQRLSNSRSAPSLYSDAARSSTPKTPLGSIGISSRTGTSMARKTWDWDDLQSTRSIVREREAARFAKILGRSTLSSVPGDAPLCVTKSQYYRGGLAHNSKHGDPRWYTGVDFF
eukprot:gnl/TRDRNA2_/TRDRNA2_37990_c0_seq1.p1 gnl/TRDRNA2_/TRDRNA2_37990_c0~~gnl/TRDRNA2_/TRDRNA2_37990_c0_seq1.p1  ORF type:complete len:192 (+),score=22.45 gnl/TRDRNA2_/TRDRNA2_37990_c0_seq1:70-576(+)